MSLTSTARRATYAGPSAATQYAAPFLFFNNADLRVTRKDSGGTQTVQTINVNYTVSGAGNVSGGVITLIGFTVLTGETLIIERLVSPVQATSLTNLGELFPSSAENALDYVVQLAQQHEALLGAYVDADTRVLKLTANETDGASSYNARGNRVRNAAPGVDANDLITLSQLSGTLAVGNMTIPGSSTVNAVVLWNSTAGNSVKNSLVLINSGAVSGVTSLVMAGALSGVTNLTMAGTLGVTGPANVSGLGTFGSLLAGATTLGVTGTGNLTVTGTINASSTTTLSALVAAGTTLGATTTTTLNASGAVTHQSATTLTGATTATGGIVGGKPYNAGTWSVTAATQGNNTTPVASTIYAGSIFLAANATITGIQFLVGTASGNAVVVSLYKADGTLVANSVTGAGTAVPTPAVIQKVAFTAPYAAVGPAYYFVGINFNGTTVRFMTVPDNTFINGVVGSNAAQTFGTPANITPPTVFVSASVPVASLY